MDATDFKHVVGVFRERSKAVQAIDKLKRIGIGEDRIQLTEYNPQNEEETGSLSRHESNKRLIVSVEADGKQQQAVGILVSNGANNADIPPGTQLVHGSLFSTNAEPVDLNPGQPADESSSEGFFGKNARDPYIP